MIHAVNGNPLNLIPPGMDVVDFGTSQRIQAAIAEFVALE